MSITGIPELKKGYRQLGPVKFIGMMVAVLAYIFGGVALQMTLDWPDHYGFHCHGRGCLIDDMWHSPALLHTHRPLEMLLFAYFWSMPAFVLGVIVWSRLKKRSQAKDLSVPISKSSDPE